MHPAVPTSAGGPREAIVAGVAQVMGVDAASLRDDTPLAMLGWDSLARVCLHDLLCESGWSLAPAAPAMLTVGDLVTSCRVSSEAAPR